MTSFGPASLRAALALLPFVLLAGCDRNIEPFVPGEAPREPDLSKIFPEGAERAADRANLAAGEVEMPAPPQRGGRGADPSSEASPIRGVILVADELQSQVTDGATLFLIARTGAGGPPLAVQRFAAPRFPLEFALGPEHRMIQTLPFAGELRLTARLDRDGDAGSRTPGDLQGAAEGAFAPGATGVELVLDEVL